MVLFTGFFTSTFKSDIILKISNKRKSAREQVRLMEFKKVMFGYNVSEVEKKIKEVEAEIAAKQEQAESARVQAAADNRELMEQLKALYTDKVEADEFDQRIGNILRKAFVASSEEVFSFKNQANQNINSKYDRLESLKEKNYDVNESIDKLLIKLVNIANG
jgi:DNA repair exonuclease SbcCD ATPase subunit